MMMGNENKKIKYGEGQQRVGDKANRRIPKNGRGKERRIK